MSSSDQLNTEELTSRIWDGCGHHTAQNAAFLLGMTDELPELSPTEKHQLLMVQALSNAENGGGYPPTTASELCEASGIDEPDNSHKVPFYIPQNTTNPDVANANVLIHFSESEYRTNVFEWICTTMGLLSTYDKLGCKLTTAPKAAVMRLLTSDDIKMVFEAVNYARKEQVKGNGRGKLKKIAVEIINLVSTNKSCVMPPNNAHFDGLHQIHQPCARSSAMVPDSPVIHVHLPQYPHTFVDSHSSNIPVSASSLGVTRGGGIDHQYAVYLDSELDNENDAIGVIFNLAAILEGLTGMLDGEAALYQEWVMKEMVKRMNENWKMRTIRKGKKKACISTPEDEQWDLEKENLPPITSNSWG
ncbi:hypothetical protein FIBSPDRAFT_945665 [Athelia psychrophila]|uniref:Uncharacterized protein n=1 Tax=Athelia psychrophila TaxID=1759441 RepID=A0A166TL69_9AGAM|nr:hypothetical protein FIBSPDRAFT_945665 [Fibularhizoctonia sp. CBS 109695]